MSPLTLSPASLADVPTLVSIYFGSFHNAFARSAFPDLPGVRQWWTDVLTSAFADPQLAVMKVVDSRTGDIVAWAKWSRPRNGHLPNISLPDFVEGMNTKTCEEYMPRMAEKRREIMGRRGHWYLQVLGTLPAHRGRGAASMLLNDALERADDEGVETYVEASPEGVGLYRRFGFEESAVVETHIDGFGSYRNLCMLRAPKEGSS